MGNEDELADVRRLLKETSERAQRAEMELELARRTAKDLIDAFSEKEQLLREMAAAAPRLISLVRTDDAGLLHAHAFLKLVGRAVDLTEVSGG